MFQLEQRYCTDTGRRVPSRNTELLYELVLFEDLTSLGPQSDN